MLRTVLLFLSVTGLYARPLRSDDLRFRNGGWIHNAPQLIQDQYMDEPRWEVVRTPDNEATGRDNQQRKSVPIEDRRQGTEPSRRFLVDLNTGFLKEHSSEMDRRVSGFYNYPSNYEFRQGTQNSQATLMDIRIGQLLPRHSEMQRSTAPLDGFRQGTKFGTATLKALRKTQMDTEVSQDDAVSTDRTHKGVPTELRRQGTEPSRRFLMDLNTRMLKEHSSEMDRRVSGFYNYPSNHEFRQGTQNSQATLVDVRTGQILEPLSEMQRTAMFASEDRRGTVHSHDISKELQDNHIVENIEGGVPEFRSGTKYSQAQSTYLHNLKPHGSNDVMISSVIEGPSHPEQSRHGMEYIHGNLIENHIVKSSEIRKSAGESWWAFPPLATQRPISANCVYTEYVLIKQTMP